MIVKHNMADKYKRMATILFALYLLILCWIILLKMGFTLSAPDSIRKINLVPLAESYYADGRLNAREIVENALLFVPFGVFCAMLYGKSRAICRIGAGFLLSLAFEITQYVLSIGVSDVTDLLSNTAGAAAGTLFMALSYRITKNKARLDRALTIIALILCILFLALAALLMLANIER